MSDFDDLQIDQTVTGQESLLSEEAMAWFARLRSECCSADERQAFESWRTKSPAHARAFDEACALWNDPALLAAASESAHTSGQVARSETTRSRSPRRLMRFALAASVAGLLIIVGLQLEIPLWLASDYRTLTGERQVVRLPDHSTVTLNTRSAMSAEFDATSRRVHLLKGEAFFQVAPDKQRAFVVDSRRITTRAVGTAFLVREEPDGVRVTVTEGVVELAPSRLSWLPVQLTAGQQVSVGSAGPGSVRAVDLGQATAWLRGRLVVEDAPLSDVLDDLRRYHSGTIQVWNSSVNDIRVSGSYNLIDPAGVLTTLVQTLPVRMARITDRIIILF